MQITPNDIAAVIVTRGDVDLAPILDTLPYPEVVIWDNSKRPVDLGVFGRYAAIAETTKPIIYFQDDDVIFTAHAELMKQYRPGTLLANMDKPWVRAGKYEETVCVGAGSLTSRILPAEAFARYAATYPIDPWLHYECDLIFGTLAPWHRIDLGYRVRDVAKRPDRLCRQPWQTEQKKLAMERAKLVRDRVPGL